MDVINEERQEFNKNILVSKLATHAAFSLVCAYFSISLHLGIRADALNSSRIWVFNLMKTLHCISSTANYACMQTLFVICSAENKSTWDWIILYLLF